MSRWLKSLVTGGRFGGGEILSRQSLALLFDRQFTRHPSLPGRTIVFREGQLYSPAELYLASTGGGFSSVMMLLPESRIGLFAAVNCEVDLWPPVYTALAQVAPRSARETNGRAAATEPFDWSRYPGYWRDAATSLGSPEMLISLIEQIRLQPGTHGGLRWRQRSFEPRGAGVLEERDGDLRLIALDSTARLRLQSSDGRVWERLRWFESRPVQSLLWVLFSMVFLAAGWPRPLPLSGGSGPDSTGTYRSQWPLAAARLAATLHFVFIVALGVLVAIFLRSSAPLLRYGIPFAVQIGLTLPLLAGGLSLAAVTGLVLTWRSPLWTRHRRLLATGLILVSIAFLAFLRSWNLLGFHI